jgi:dienelactone hydrolase
MGERTDVTFTSGGLACAAWLYRPEAADRPVPCVVMAHGFSATREEGLADYAERFAAAGMAVLVFDYRHFGDSEGEPRQLLEIGRQHDDYRAAIAYARALDFVDADRIALFGSSFSGGHVVCVAATDERLAAVVAQCPHADGIATLRVLAPKNAARATLDGIVDQVGALVGRPPRMIPAVGAPGTLAAMTAPEAEPGFTALVPDGSRWRNEVAARVMLHIALYRPITKAPKVRCPLLICACDRDETTPPQAAVKMGERAPRGEVRHYPVGHFDIYKGAAFEQAVADQVSFFEKHLVTTLTPTAAARRV